MPRISSADAGGRNVCALLDCIAYAEIGTAMLENPLTDDGYRVLVGSTSNKVWLFTPYDDHPFPSDRWAIEYSNGLHSTAAGRYQILNTYWPHYRDQLGLPDFGPVSQDRYAIQMMIEQGALEPIRAGRFDEAVERIRNIWASMPGAGYGQREHSLERLRTVYENCGGFFCQG